MYFAECPRMTLGTESFAECQMVALGKVHWNNLCRVSPCWHSAKRTLPSARSGALGKDYFKIKKNLCRVPDRGHSAKSAYIALSNSFLLPSLSLSYRAAAAPLPHHAPAPSVAVAPSRRRPRRPTAVPSLPSPARRALARPPPKCTPGKCTRPTSNPRAPSSRPRPNLQGDCLLSFCDIVIKKLYVLRVWLR
jgi:hypothetical protein